METESSTNSMTRIIGPDDDEDVFEVEKILKKRRHQTKGVMYFVKWKNFPASANTWEPASNFSQTLIDNYESTHPETANKRRKTTHNLSQQTKASISSALTATSTTTTITTTTTIGSSTSTTMPTGATLDKKPIDLNSEVIYDPDLTKDPIIVTDVTTKDLTVTISECNTSEGFFTNT